MQAPTWFHGDAMPDPEQLIALLKLAADKGQFDLLMALAKDGSPIIGETPRRLGDGKPRLEIEGYLWAVAQRSGAGMAGRQPYTLFVVRRCDAATASLMSALTSASEELCVTLGAWRAGDDEPTLEIVVDKARLVVHCLLTAPGSDGPSEVLGFAGRKFEVRSAPQQGSGLRGGVRTCAFEAPK